MTTARHEVTHTLQVLIVDDDADVRLVMRLSISMRFGPQVSSEEADEGFAACS
jgi:hypothetical protein